MKEIYKIEIEGDNKEEMKSIFKEINSILAKYNKNSFKQKILTEKRLIPKFEVN